MDNLRRCTVWRCSFDLHLWRPVCSLANSYGDSDSPAESRTSANVYPRTDGCSDPCAHSDSHPNTRTDT